MDQQAARACPAPVCATLCVMDRVGAVNYGRTSAFTSRVKRGETLEVTEHGRPVAVLSPRLPFASECWRRVASSLASSSSVISRPCPPRARSQSSPRRWPQTAQSKPSRLDLSRYVRAGQAGQAGARNRCAARPPQAGGPSDHVEHDRHDRAREAVGGVGLSVSSPAP